MGNLTVLRFGPAPAQVRAILQLSGPLSALEGTSVGWLRDRLNELPDDAVLRVVVRDEETCLEASW